MNNGNKNSIKYKLILHEPIAPYFTNTYNTLLSVVQGLSLGYLFIKFGEYINHATINKDYSRLNFLHKLLIFSIPEHCDFLFKFILIFCMAALLWHRYVVHDQYLAWRLNWFDTFILMLFALIQYLLILSLDQTLYDFTFFTFIFYILGLLAYFYAQRKNKKEHAQLIYKEHVINLDENNEQIGIEFSDIFLNEVNKFEKKADITMLICILIHLLFIIIFSFINNPNWHVLTIIYFCISFLMLIILFRFDLQFHLKKAKSLDKYNIPW